MFRIEKIRKRSGQFADFDPAKIHAAMGKAFHAVRGGARASQLDELTAEVMRALQGSFSQDTPPSVEDVQNIVEKALMEAGFFDVAKGYIIYRYEHTRGRQEKKEETVRKIESNGITVKKRDGSTQAFDKDKLAASLAHALKGLEGEIDGAAIVEQCASELFDGMTTEQVRRALLLATRSLIEKDPAYSVASARLLLSDLYGRVIGPDTVDYGTLDEQYRQAFQEGVRNGVKIGRLDAALLAMDLDRLAAAIKPERDELFKYMGIQVLEDRYLLSNPETKEILELPQAFWMRVAMGLALKEDEQEKRAIEFYEILSTLRFVASTPTLFHSGTTHPQLSSCYLTTVEDSLDHIFKCIGDNAQLSKWSGGIGNDWTSLRATGALIRGTGVESQGVIPFLKIANDTTVAINRSGRRRGATAAYLETWHLDIEEFLELRKNAGDERRRTHDMNTANWIPDLFMKRLRDNAEWTLFSPDEVPDLHHLFGRKFEEAYERYEKLAGEGRIKLFKRVKAQDLWRKMLTMLFETGHPWVTFKDPCNVRSPQDHEGVVHNSNLCTEITLNTSADETAVCNLGSVNLARHVTAKGLDASLVRDTVRTAMRMLDNVIDVNYYPTTEARNANMRHRPVGIGIMGFQDALFVMGMDFDTDETVAFADQSMELVSYSAILASSELAKERGRYASYAGSKWDRGFLPQDTVALLAEERGQALDVPGGGVLDWGPVRESVRQHGMRNSNCLAIAPTATISNIAGCFPSIEPIYKNLYVKANQSGDFTVVNPYLVAELKERNLWDFELLGKIKYADGDISEIPEIPEDIRKRHKEAFQIDPSRLIQAAAARGKWIDQSQSLNLFYAGTSGKQISRIYMLAWEAGLKTTYYLRTLGMSQVEKSTVRTQDYGSTHLRKKSEPEPKHAPAARGETVSDAPEPRPVSPAIEPKLCRVEDPECEACQ